MSGLVLAAGLSCTGEIDVPGHAGSEPGASEASGRATTGGFSEGPQAAGGDTGADGGADSGSGSASAGTSASSSSASGGSGGSSGTLADGGGMIVPSGSCATADVRLIFQASCAEGACHDATDPAAMLDLSGADPAGALLGTSALLCPEQVQLMAGEPAQSYLWNKLTDEMPACGDPMPVGGTLSDAELECIEQWIVGLVDGPDCETCGGTACVDVTNDAVHCGACGVACQAGQVCDAGACVGCADGRTACGTSCVDTQSDPNHCGGCGQGCGAGESCVSGSCGCAADPTLSFAADIEPLLEAACAGKACHGGQMPKEGLDLNAGAGYDDMVGVVADQCNDGRLLVEPGAPADSYLLHKLTGADLCSGSLMPKADGALPADSIAKISAWICSGAPNN